MWNRTHGSLEGIPSLCDNFIICSSATIFFHGIQGDLLYLRLVHKDEDSSDNFDDEDDQNKEKELKTDIIIL